MSPLPDYFIHKFLASTIFWTIAYVFQMFIPISLKDKYVKLVWMDELDIRNRRISFLHGTIIFVLTGHEYFFSSGYCSAPNTSFQNDIFFISMGYFTYDFLAMAYYNLLDYAMTIHHFACVLGMGMCIAENQSAYLFVCALFIGEVSNPPMHITKILRRLGLRYTKLYELNEIIFMMLYCTFRIILGTKKVYDILICHDVNLVLKMCGVVLMVQSYHFTIQMISILKNRFKEISKRYQHKITMNWVYPPLSTKDLNILGIDLKSKSEKLSL